MNVYYTSALWFSAMGPAALLYSLLAPLFVSVDVTPLPPATTATTTGTRGWAIVTGSNTGIGYETARALAQDYNYSVILACRSEAKGKAAADSINADLAERRAHFGALDLTSFASIRAFVDTLEDKRIEILVNNAGRNTQPTEPTVDGLDNLFQTNFAGHFVLTKEIIDRGLLVDRATNGGKLPRIVNLASVMHHFIDADDKQLASPQFWTDMAIRPQTVLLYSYTKLAAILFSVELNKRYATKFQAISVNPGGVNSDIWRSFPSIMRHLFAYIYLTSQQGAHTSIAAAVGDFHDPSLVAEGPPLYLQPYWMPFNATHQPPLPVWEMLGPFSGHLPIAPRLHANYRDQAAALWQAMSELSLSTAAPPRSSSTGTEDVDAGDEL